MSTDRSVNKEVGEKWRVTEWMTERQRPGKTGHEEGERQRNKPRTTHTEKRKEKQKGREKGKEERRRKRRGQERMIILEIKKSNME